MEELYKREASVQVIYLPNKLETTYVQIMTKVAGCLTFGLGP